MESRITMGDNKTMKQILNLNHKDSWAEQNKGIKKELDIKDNDLKSTKYHPKYILQIKIKEHLEKRLKKTGEIKSKMKYCMDGKSNWKASKRA